MSTAEISTISFIVQGNAVFFPDDEAKANAKGCNCNMKHGCRHSFLARRILNNHWSEDEIDGLTTFIVGCRGLLSEIILKTFGFSGEYIDLDFIMDPESQERLCEGIFRCEYCNCWKPTEERYASNFDFCESCGRKLFE